MPDTPTHPNDTIAMDIVGTLPITPRGYEYILSIQDQLTRYLILIPLRNTQAETIIEQLNNDWTRRHEYYLNKAKERLEITKLRNKKIQDSRKVILQSLYKPGGLVKYPNFNPANKLSPSCKGPATIVTRHDNNNYSINFQGETFRLHDNLLMPYCR